MLTRLPVFAAAVPRFHVGRRGTDGSLSVVDRASDERFRIYAPRLESQFRGGHRAGLWYLRPAADAGHSPKSPGFPSAKAALDSLHSRSRSLSSPPVSHRPACRVIWGSQGDGRA